MSRPELPPMRADLEAVEPIAWAVVDRDDRLIQLCHAEASAKRAVYEVEGRYTNGPFKVVGLHAVPALLARLEAVEALLKALALTVKESTYENGGDRYYSYIEGTPWDGLPALLDRVDAALSPRPS